MCTFVTTAWLYVSIGLIDLRYLCVDRWYDPDRACYSSLIGAGSMPFNTIEEECDLWR